MFFCCSYSYRLADFVQICSSSGIDSKWISMFSRRSWLRLGSAGRGAFPGISTVDIRSRSSHLSGELVHSAPSGRGTLFWNFAEVSCFLGSNISKVTGKKDDYTLYTVFFSGLCYPLLNMITRNHHHGNLTWLFFTNGRPSKRMPVKTCNCVIYVGCPGGASSHGRDPATKIEDWE